MGKEGRLGREAGRCSGISVSGSATCSSNSGGMKVGGTGAEALKRKRRFLPSLRWRLFVHCQPVLLWLQMPLGLLQVLQVMVVELLLLLLLLLPLFLYGADATTITTTTTTTTVRIAN